MRKKISCKVIRSVPLGACEGGRHSSGGQEAVRTVAGNVAGFTRTGRPLMTTAWAENGMRSPILDLYV